MTDTHGHVRVCPTRTDGVEILFAHKVTLGQCQDRQRGQYHKCYTCAHNNTRTAGKKPAPAAHKPLVETGSRPKLSKRLASR